MRGKPHDPQTKAAVMAALMTGQGIEQVAKETGVPARTITDWANSEQFADVRDKKGERIENLTFEYLSALLAGLKTQVEVVSTREYLQKQPASEVAVLHGVLADKAFRLLSALPVGSGVDEAATGSGTGEPPTGD